MYKLYFENEYNVERVVEEVATLKDTFAAIHNFCAERNFKVYYIRFHKTISYNQEPCKIKVTFDCGSWSEFFNIYFDTDEEATKFLEGSLN